MIDNLFDTADVEQHFKRMAEDFSAWGGAAAITTEQIKQLAAVLSKPPIAIYPETLNRCEWAVNTVRDLQFMERVGIS